MPPNNPYSYGNKIQQEKQARFTEEKFTFKNCIKSPELQKSERIQFVTILISC